MAPPDRPKPTCTASASNHNKAQQCRTFWRSLPATQTLCPVGGSAYLSEQEAVTMSPMLLRSNQSNLPHSLDVDTGCDNN